jgi:hypothetical protein
MNDVKKILLKSIKLQKAFDSYNNEDQISKKEVFTMFEKTWGTSLANHFLGKYANAESLIWALDNENLELFMKLF